MSHAATLFDSSSEPGLTALAVAEGAQPSAPNSLLLGRTILLLEAPEVAHGYIANQTNEQARTYYGLTRGVLARAESMSRELGRIHAAIISGGDMDADIARRFGMEWYPLVQATGQLALGAVSVTLKEYLALTYLERAYSSTNFMDKLDQTLQALEVGQDRAQIKWETLLTELKQRVNDPDFIDAANAWAPCPDDNGDTGPDGLGYNGMLIHLVRYQASRTSRGDKPGRKSKRFSYLPPLKCVDDLIDLTRNVQNELATCGDRYSANHRAIIEDTEGNIKYLVRQPDGVLIVAFQRSGEDVPKISSVMASVRAESFLQKAKKLADGQDNSPIHRLGVIKNSDIKEPRNKKSRRSALREVA